jgi:hypothetical protein
VYCLFRITQHSKDLELMQLFTGTGTGKVAVRSSTSTPRCDFIVQDAATLLNIIIPRALPCLQPPRVAKLARSHFDLYPPLLNLKQEDFLCFRQALLLIKVFCV